MSETKAIAVVDDDSEHREGVSQRLGLALSPSLKVFAHAPLKRVEDYPSWINEEQLVGLILDQRLNQKRNDGLAVDYEGHDVLVALAKELPNFPVWILTSFTQENELQPHILTARSVIDRRYFNKNTKLVAARVHTDASQYDQNHYGKLSILSSLAEKIADGTATTAEKRKARELQGQLVLPSNVQELTQQSEWIKQAEKELDELRSLRVKISKSLKTSDGKRPSKK